MFRIEIFIGRNISDHIEIYSLRINAVIEEQLIILQQMPEPETIIQISLLAAVPMPHHRNVAVFRITETAARKSLRWKLRILFAHSELRIVRRGIEIVVAVLIVKNVPVAKFASGIDESFESFPAASLFRRRERIRMLPVVTEMRPTGNEDQNPIESARLQVAQLFCSFIKGGQAIVLRKVFGVVPIAVGTHVSQNAQSRLR